MDREQVQVYFDDLCERYEEGYHRSEVRGEVRLNLRRFIENEMDIHKIVRMMDPRDVVEYFTTLTKAGARISPKKLVARLSPSFIYDHLVKLGAIGADVNQLFEANKHVFLREDDEVLSINYEAIVGGLIARGVDVERLFEACVPVFEGNFELYGYEDKQVLNIAKFFVKNGLKTERIKEWLEPKVKDGLFLEEMFHDKAVADTLMSIGINPRNYITRFINTYGHDYLLELGEYQSEMIPVDRLVQKLPYDEIAQNYTIYDFIMLFLERGGHIEVLAKKFVSDVGYKITWGHLKDLIDIMEYDGACNEVDLERLAKEASFEGLDLEDPSDQIYLEKLYDHLVENRAGLSLAKRIKALLDTVEHEDWKK